MRTREQAEEAAQETSETVGPGAPTSMEFAWAKALHEAVFGEVSSRTGFGRLASSPTDVQFMLVAPDGASVIGSAACRDREQVLEGEALAQDLRTKLAGLLGRTVRCIHTQGPASALPSIWSDGERGTLSLVFGKEWLTSMPPPPPCIGQDIVVEVPLGDSKLHDPATLALGDAAQVRVVVSGARFRGSLRCTTAECWVEPVEVDGGAPGASAIFKARVLSRERGRWELSVRANGEAHIGGRKVGGATWVTSGENMGVRYEPDPSKPQRARSHAATDEAPTVAIRRPGEELVAALDLQRGLGGPR